jgi:hypothetical protein
MNHVIDRLPRRFNEGPFWGNASMGALLYTDDAALRFAVDHVGLWETRDHTGGALPITFQRAREVMQPEFARHFGSSFDWKSGPCPTRLPGLTLRLVGSGAITEFRSTTDLSAAESEVTWRHEQGRVNHARVWVHADTDVLVFESSSLEDNQLAVQLAGWDLELPALAPLAAWDYAPATRSDHAHGDHLIQEFCGDRAAVVSTWCTDSLLLCAISTGAATESTELCGANEKRMETVAAGLPAFRQSHRLAWEELWSPFSVSLPDSLLQHSVEIELYKLYCNARPGTPPMTLQGVWNHDQAMPAWGGDWHNDLNVQACYWASFKTGHADLARPYIDYYTDSIPHFQKRAKDFVGVDDGISVPTAMAPGGAGAGAEWTFWNSLLGPELYVAVDFCWYYEYTQDRDVLRDTVVPYLLGVARFYDAILERRDDGRLHLPFAHSPELFNEKGLVLTDDTTFMVSSLRYVLDQLVAYQKLLGSPEESTHWQAMASDLVEVSVGEKGLQLWPGADLAEPHRHFCHLFPIFPLAQIDRSDENEDAVIQASLDHLADCGAVEYAAFSFPYRAVLSARAGRGDAARLQLYNYLLGLQAPNTFCVNGDAFRTGVIMSSAESAGQPSDVFTLEAGLIVPAAVCEMLAYRAGDTLWLLPALPTDWKEGSVRGITIEGGHRVDLAFSNYTLQHAVVYPGRDEDLTIVIGAAAAGYQARVNGNPVVTTTGDVPFSVPMRHASGPVEIDRR